MKFKDVEKGMSLYFRKNDRDSQFFIIDKDEDKITLIEINHKYDYITKSIVYKKIWDFKYRIYKDTKEEIDFKTHRNVVEKLFEDKLEWKKTMVFK